MYYLLFCPKEKSRQGGCLPGIRAFCYLPEQPAVPLGLAAGRGVDQFPGGDPAICLEKSGHSRADGDGGDGDRHGMADSGRETGNCRRNGASLPDVWLWILV